MDLRRTAFELARPSALAAVLIGVPGAVAMLMGTLCVHALPDLPTRAWLIGILLFAIGLLSLPRLRLFAAVLLGFAWCALRAEFAMQARLPYALEGQDVQVIGSIEGLPRQREEATRFGLRVESAALADAPVALHGLLRLSWYEDAPATLRACGRWQLRLRLKRPRGFVNPGGYDSERQALERGVIAVGHVRSDPANRQIDTAAWCVDGLRERLAEAITARVADPHDAALLRAFAIGDTRGLDDEDWQVARINGVSHLIAISGFHVGVAGAFGAVLAWLLWACWPRLGLAIAFPQAQAVATLCTATLYGILAGGSLPTVRTLLMISVFALTRLARRHGAGLHTLALALLAVLAFDPLATLAPGFWLSFVGVAFLMICIERGTHSMRGFLRELTLGQLVMTVALLPLGVWFFGEASLIGAFANLVAVPLVSFVIVPLCLLATLALLTLPVIATPLLVAAAWLSHLQWRLLEWSATLPAAHGYLPPPSLWALLLALVGALWLFLPRAVPARALGIVLFLPLLWPRIALPAAGAFQAVVLDVGQGLAVIVRTRGHVMVYDTGARFRSGFDLGDAVVLPSLHALGVRRLDTLVISHGDNDHAGGAAAVVQALPPARVLAGEAGRIDVAAETCRAGQTWRWDGVTFRVLSPAPDEENGTLANARSCVILVSGTGGRLLLSGDIGAEREPAVAAATGNGPPLVLLVPHHGSRTSSSEAFLDALDLQLAIVSAGWRNRFGHPHLQTVARYAERGIALENTAVAGALTLDFPATAPPRLAARERERQRRHWRE